MGEQETNKTILEREELIERVEALLIMGFTRPTEIMRQEPRIKDWETAKRYLSIAQRRLRNRYKKINTDKILKKELRDLDYMEKKLWLNYHGAINANEKTGAINGILKCKERRAKLLGLDTENINPAMAKTLEDLLKEDDEKNEQTINRGASVDTKQAGSQSSVQAEQSSADVGTNESDQNTGA